jgi:hypothetical protein
LRTVAAKRATIGSAAARDRPRIRPVMIIVF